MEVPEYDCETPYSKGLGGTQSAICYYAEALAKTHQVSIALLNATTPKKVREVSFLPVESLTSDMKPDVVIACSGISKTFISVSKKYFQDSFIIAWIPHNTYECAMDNMEEMMYYFDVFAFVSDWQRNQYITTYGLDPSKTMLMLNGIAPSFYSSFDILSKKPYFLYTTQANRGLIHVIDGWSRIVEAYPHAELHVYSSKMIYNGIDCSTIFERMKDMPNVKCFEPIGQTELAEKYREASFFAYPATVCETGCIVVTEACASGCLPIVSNLGALGTYFNNCLIYDETLTDKFVKRACALLELYYTDKLKIYQIATDLSNINKEERDYNRLCKLFEQNVYKFKDCKKESLINFKYAEKMFLKEDYLETRRYLQLITPFFNDKSTLHLYYLWFGVSNYHLGNYQNAFIYFNKAFKYGNSLQLCINMILTNEKIEKPDNVLLWCERALKFEFNLAIINKIMKIIPSKLYFERCKWSKYLLSLWNNDIQDITWLTLFLSHGNIIAGDLTLVMHHEEAIELLTNLIHKALAYIELYKLNIKTRNSIRISIEKLFSNIFLNMNYYENRNPELYKYIQYYMKELPPTLNIIKTTYIPIETGRKLRIGFLSGDLVWHPVSYILNGIVKYMDTTKFETHIFSTTEKKDNSLQNTLRKECTKYYELFDKSATEIKDTIIIEDIDVLIEMSGHTTNGTNLLDVLRWKPARVLANYFAYPNSYGIPEMDYKIGDSVVFPIGLEKYYVEGFCKIKGGLHTYKPIMELSVNHKAHEGIVFGCTNNPKKYRPNWIKAVSKILKGVEGSKLKMRYFNLDDPSIQEFYWKEFEKHGITRDRVDLGLGETLNKYFESYADMDICLDPYPYNGGTINIEILYASLPYITLLGNSYVSRVGASILHQVGHPELIAKTEEQYVQMTIDLAKDAERIKTYKQTLRADMMKSTLGDNKAFAREFEKGIEWMLKEKGWL